MADKVMKMPVNYEAEQAMLGSIMMDTNVANDFTTLLREDDFALQQHKQIFLAIYNLIQNNEPVDALTVADKLATRRAVWNTSENSQPEFPAPQTPTSILKS